MLKNISSLKEIYTYSTSGQHLVMHIATTLRIAPLMRSKPDLVTGTSGGAFVALLASRSDWQTDALRENMLLVDHSTISLKGFKLNFSPLMMSTIDVLLENPGVPVSCSTYSKTRGRAVYASELVGDANDDVSTKMLTGEDICDSARIPFMFDSENDNYDGMLSGTTPLLNVNLTGVDKIAWFTIYGSAKSCTSTVTVIMENSHKNEVEIVLARMGGRWVKGMTSSLETAYRQYYAADRCVMVVTQLTSLRYGLTGFNSDTIDQTVDEGKFLINIYTQDVS